MESQDVPGSEPHMQQESEPAMQQEAEPADAAGGRARDEQEAEPAMHAGVEAVTARVEARDAAGVRSRPMKQESKPGMQQESGSS